MEVAQKIWDAAIKPIADAFAGWGRSIADAANSGFAFAQDDDPSNDNVKNMMAGISMTMDAVFSGLFWVILGLVIVIEAIAAIITVITTITTWGAASADNIMAAVGPAAMGEAFLKSGVLGDIIKMMVFGILSLGGATFAWAETLDILAIGLQNGVF